MPYDQYLINRITILLGGRAAGFERAVRGARQEDRAGQQPG